jgi:hypothetical protein
MNIKQHLVLTPALIVELILVACLFGIGSALAMNASVPMTSQGSAAGRGDLSGTANLEVSNYRFNYNTALTGVESVTVKLSNRDGAAAHSAVVHVSMGDSAGMVTKTGDSGTAASVPAAGVVEEKVTLSGVLALAEMDWISVVVEEA